MSARPVGARMKATGRPVTDWLTAAFALGLLGYLAITTMRPVYHNAAATNAALHGDDTAAERHLIAAATTARRFDAQGSLTIAVERLADLYWKAERFAESEQQLLQLLELRELRVGSRHLLVAEVLDRLGLAAQQEGKLDRAESYLRRSLAIREEARGTRNVQTARSLLRLGSLYRVSRETVRADLYLSQSMAILEEQTASSPMLFQVFPGLGAHSADVSKQRILAEVLYELAGVRSSQGRLGEAKALNERTLALSRELDLPPEFEAASLSQLGALHQATGETDAALACYRQARVLVDLHGLQGSRLEASVLVNLAASQAASGHPTQAGSSLDDVRRVAGTRLSKASPLSMVVSANGKPLDSAL